MGCEGGSHGYSSKLRSTLQLPGPSGREDAVASQAMELLRPLMDEVKKDRFGNVIGIRRCGTENAKRVVLDATWMRLAW